MKRNIFACGLFLSACLAFSQTSAKKPEYSNYSWRIFENAKVAFDSARYGEAMNLANKAKQSRNAEIEWEVSVIETACAPLAVRRVGESFSEVLKILRERDETEAVNLIEKYLRLYGSVFFGDSTSKLVSWLKAKTVYPEADFLIGRIYQLEGEYSLAYDFYERARLERAYLDIPNQVYDILYAMADLARDANHQKEYDEALLLILDYDDAYKNDTLKRSMIRYIDANKAENVDKFFLMFRADNKNSVRALYELANNEEETGFADQALTSTALATVESFTHLLGAICERDTSYEYTTLSDFFKKCNSYEDIANWGSKNNVWELFFLLAERSEKRGKMIFSQNLFQVLATSLPDGYWRQKASYRLKR